MSPFTYHNLTNSAGLLLPMSGLSANSICRPKANRLVTTH